MNQSFSQIISGIATWDQLKQFESNARERNRLDDELVAAIKARGEDLGRALIAERTGLNLSDLSPAEAKIVQAVSEYVSVMRQQGKYPQRTFDQLRNRGLRDAAESAVARARPTQGFQTLVDADLEDLSYEQIVIDHPDEFSPRALWFSRRTLGLPTSTDKPPTSIESDTQRRTAALLVWLRQVAEDSAGLVPRFTNVDAGRVMGMDDLQRYGQVHGNIQSRIDFACYVCGLPPLGLAADAPFERAWGQQDRDWAFPIRSMQNAAQRRVWTASDFDKVLRQTEQLSGLAHSLWREALLKNEAMVKAWALSFGQHDAFEGHGEVEQDSEQRQQRNPDWTRDELILALDLYIERRLNLPSKDSAEIAALSDLLNQIALALKGTVSGTFRNSNGVYMKLMNFRRLDPLYTGDGKVGLQRGNKDEQVVWGEFAHDPVRLSAVAEAIRSTLSDDATADVLGTDDDPDITEAEEGRVLTRQHRFRERSRKLVEAAKAFALKKFGRLACEACGFDFSQRYGDLGAGLIDAHHTKPLHTLVAGHKTKVEDLALLCANCHRVVHSSRRWLTVEQVRAAVGGRRSDQPPSLV